jgi:type IV pilus assembly protein PilP
MRKLSLLAIMVFAGSMMTACTDMDNLKEWCQQQRKQAPSAIEPLPQIKTFVHMKFEPKTDRMPFVIPQPEILKVQAIKPLNCEQPDRERPMEELEQFALDNLFMRGTIMTNGKLRAIIQTADGALVRVVPGMHMGLNFGKVVRVAPDSVEVEEFISDGKGCWDKRPTQIDLIVAE